MPKHNQTPHLSRIRRSLVAGLLVVVLSVGAVPRLVQAVTCSSTSDCQQQINNLNSASAVTQQSLNALALKAQSYQSAVSSLQSQISGLQQQIAANQAQQATLQNQIIANQQLIATKKASLADDVKTMYIDGQLTTIEELATSKDLSDYVDKEENHTAVQNQLNSNIQTIASLEETLQGQKASVDNLLATENTQNTQLASAEAQQSQLLAYNQQQQDAYNSQVSANQSAVAQLKAKEAAIVEAGTRSASISIPGPSSGSGGNCDNGNGNGGYPLSWCNASQDSVTTAGGFPNRECTSYAYWYFTQVEGHTDFKVSGNANEWVYTSNYATHATPAVGGLAVEAARSGDPDGHVAVVQGLPGQTVSGATVPQGYVLVSEMNYDFYGHFRYSYSPLSKFVGYVY